jgi:hypothetical protein
MASKRTITCAVLDVCVGEHKPTLDQALAEWWKNPREDAGLRLTAEGFFIFNLAEIQHYKFQLPPGIHARARTLLILDRKMTCPYYLTQGKAPEIYIYGSKEASLFALYGDVEKFLRGIARQ